MAEFLALWKGLNSKFREKARKKIVILSFYTYPWINLFSIYISSLNTIMCVYAECEPLKSPPALHVLLLYGQDESE